MLRAKGVAMRVLGLLTLCLAAAPALAGEALRLPSGQEVTLLEVIGNSPGENGLATRYRFLAPAVARQGGTVDADLAGNDMDWLCQNYALPRLSATGPRPEEIIISLSDRDVPFGQTDEAATQFFNAYSIDGDSCLWEPF